LLNVRAGRSSLFAQLGESGSALSHYLQGATLAIDCAAVASCVSRALIVEPLFSDGLT
jgi:hypothetical protein